MRRRASETANETKTKHAPVGADRESKPSSAKILAGDVIINAPTGTTPEAVVDALERSIELAARESPAFQSLVEADQKPAPAKKPTSEAASLEMPHGFERIITHQFQVVDDAELEAEYLYLRSKLAFKDPASRKSYGELQDALNEAEDDVQRAAEVFARASFAFVLFELDAKSILGSLREPAKKALDNKKKALFHAEGIKGKVISNEDIESEIAACFPDEWSELEKRRARAKLGVKLMGELKEQMAGRAWDLRTMVGRSRQVE